MPELLSVRAPDHFGDGVMALPALVALGAAAAARGQVVRVHAPPWGVELYGWLAGVEVLGREVPPREGTTGVLLKPSFGAAWRWRGLPARVGIGGNGRGWLLTRSLPPRAFEHRRDGYARVAAACGAEVPVGARPCFAPRASWDGPPVTPGFVALNAWGRTPATRWPHMHALADRLVVVGHRVVFLAGPGEGAAVRALAGPHPVVDHGPLAPLATFLDGAALVVSHDSGLAHFADACGTRVLMLHGPTDSRVTGAGRPLVARPPGGVLPRVPPVGAGALRGPTAPPQKTGDAWPGSVASRVGWRGWNLLAARVWRRRMTDLSLAQVQAAVQAALPPTG